MIIFGEDFKVIDQFDNWMTVPDCWVSSQNKIGRGHGEAKFYIGNKEEMYNFYGPKGFNAECFFLKKDLIDYMDALKNEYLFPSQNYKAKDEFPQLWQERMDKVNKLSDVIIFHIKDQNQLAGLRGYVNSDDEIYQLIRELSLPLITYISAMELQDARGSKIYYWKLFADFDAIEQRKCDPLVFTYGKKKNKDVESEKESSERETEKQKEVRYARIGQGKYRELLLEECPYCPITMINDERLLIASHIKPWAASDDKEKIDPQNGFMLSPLYDKLFDRGFITFTDDRRMHISEWITPKNIERIGLKNHMFIQKLPLNSKRIIYLDFHRKNVFHGIIE